MKFIKAQKQSNLNSSGPGPVKKQKTNVFVRKPVEDADSSSDGDKERELTKYYSSAISLANTPEEKKRREHRSKRFDKKKSESSTPNNSSSIFRRKANAMLLTKSYDDSNGTDQAVEDIDWDSLTVKGTCQETEKRYLRLTSAPDPSTVTTPTFSFSFFNSLAAKLLLSDNLELFTHSYLQFSNVVK
jgi:SAC3 family protein LENG8/THP3